MSRDLLPQRGRPARTIVMTIDRELTDEDLFRLATEEGPKLAAAPLKRMKAIHHNMARLLGEGKAINEVAILCGVSSQRVSDLSRTDPAFMELVALYQREITEANLEDSQRLNRKLIIVSETAVDEINDRINDPDELKKIPISELRQIAQFAADRTVAPPKTAVPIATTPTTVTFNIGNRDIRPKTIDQDGKEINDV